MLMTGVPCSGVIYITIYGHTFFICIICHGNKAVHIEVRVAYSMKKTKMLMIGLCCSIVIYITNLWTYLLHKRTCNKVRYIPNWYNEKNVMYIPNLVNVMYIKKNTLSLAHLLICIYYAVLLKITLYTSVCPQYKHQKNVMCINNLINAMYIKMNTLSSSPILN